MNLRITKKELNTKPIHLIAAVSLQNGLEAARLAMTPINSANFSEIFEDIVSEGAEAVLFGDNASWHRSHFTRSQLNLHSLTMIYNLPYTPQLNPIERVFSMLKSRFRAYRLQALNEQTNDTPEQILKKAIAELSKTGIQNLCKDGLDRWNANTLQQAIEDHDPHALF